MYLVIGYEAVNQFLVRPRSQTMYAMTVNYPKSDDSNYTNVRLQVPFSEVDMSLRN